MQDVFFSPTCLQNFVFQGHKPCTIFGFSPTDTVFFSSKIYQRNIITIIVSILGYLFISEK